MRAVRSLLSRAHSQRGLTSFIVGAVAAALVVGGGVAVAAIPSTSTGNITGCVLKTTGAARIIDYQAGKRCKATENSLNWAQQGVAGAIGPIGPAGTPGVSGWEIVTAMTPIDTDANKSVTAYCPASKVVVGGGGFGGNTQSSFAQNSLSGEPGRAWALYATYPEGLSWRLVVQAICVNAF
jgi:hypothetical protein